MNPRLINITALFTLAISAGLLLQGCSRSENKVAAPAPMLAEQSTQTAEGHRHAPGTPPHSHQAQLTQADWVELDQYRFRLSPEIEPGGQAHLDLYIHDAKDQHVANAQVVMALTAADGHKMTVKLVEAKADQHYMGKTMLEDLGDYQAVAQVTINGKQLNPRFSFTRQK
jgi:hypothetical protein